MNLTLTDLLKSLETDIGLNKQAEEDEKDKKKDEDKKDGDDPEKKEEKKEGDAKSNLFKAEKDVEDAEKDNKKEQEECTKEAQLKGAALAQEVMARVKTASQTPKTKDDEMKKEASVAGKALADALIEKLASAGDISTTTGISAGTVPQKNLLDAAQQVREDDSKIKPTPGTDGMHGGGSINEILDAIVADTVAQGATSFGQGVEAKARDAKEAEGVVEDHAVPNQVEDEDEREKAAAVSALVEEGYDFASAVEMVKVAAEEIEFEENVQIKQAALGALMDRGIEFDKAVLMVKAAGAVLPHGVSKAKQMFRAGVGTAKDAVGGMSRGAKMGAGAGAAAAVGAGAAVAAKRSQEKQAAVNALLEAGVDFDQAVGLVQAKSEQLYGK